MPPKLSNAAPRDAAQGRCSGTLLRDAALRDAAAYALVSLNPRHQGLRRHAPAICLATIPLLGGQNQQPGGSQPIGNLMTPAKPPGGPPLARHLATKIERGLPPKDLTTGTISPMLTDPEKVKNLTLGNQQQPGGPQLIRNLLTPARPPERPHDELPRGPPRAGRLATKIQQGPAPEDPMPVNQRSRV